MDPQQFNPGPPPGISRFIGGVFGLAFFGVGISVIGFLWSQPFGSFHSPPLFFRIVGSFIAMVFVAVGGGILYGSITGKGMASNRFRHVSRIMRQAQQENEVADDQPMATEGYSCESCGAPLDSDADVSPLGDVKCAHCDRWFNIHGKRS